MAASSPPSRKRGRSPEEEEEVVELFKHHRSEIKEPLTTREQIFRKLQELEQLRQVPIVPTALKGIMSEYLQGCDELTDRGQLCSKTWHPSPSHVDCSKYCVDTCSAWFSNLLNNTPTVVQLQYLSSGPSKSPGTPIIRDVEIHIIKFESKGKFHCPGRKPVTYVANFEKYAINYLSEALITYQIQDEEIKSSRSVDYSPASDGKFTVDIQEFCQILARHNNLNVELTLAHTHISPEIIHNKSLVILFPEMEDNKWLLYPETNGWSVTKSSIEPDRLALSASFRINIENIENIFPESYCLPKWQSIIDEKKYSGIPMNIFN